MQCHIMSCSAICLHTAPQDHKKTLKYSKIMHNEIVLITTENNVSIVLHFKPRAGAKMS